ncbi:MAG TPA: 50S ribosomal protein L30 [archaeon]|nr:50S ribosomal protein L30 [archaeon]
MVAIRIRGTVGVKGDIAYALENIKLFKKNHAVLLKEEPSQLGMLHKVKDYVTFGKISDQMLQKLLEKRGRVGKMRLKEAMKQLGYPSVDALAKDINSGKKIEGLKPVFALSPPSGGFKGSTKDSYPKGELGNRKEAINDLLKRMI